MGHVIKKLLKHAKTDSFSESEALLTVAPYSGSQMISIPGDINPGTGNVNISSRQLDILLGQIERSLTWDKCELEILCSARYYSLPHGDLEIQLHIAFWVTGQAEDVSIYLWTKLDLI